MSSIDLTPRRRTSAARKVKASKKETNSGGIEFARYFTIAGVDVYDT